MVKKFVRNTNFVFFFRLKNEEEMLSVENEVLDVEGLNPEENAKDRHLLNNGSELTSKFTPQA